MSDDLYAIAPPGTIYVCGACGKTSRNRAGFLDDGGRGIDSDEHGRIAKAGWDESCMLHAVLCKDQRADGRWEAVDG